MAFNVGDRVWFKAVGKTPYVVGNATNAATVVDGSLGGRGEATISLTPALVGLGNEQGVPELNVAGFPTGSDSQETVIGVVPSAPSAVVVSVAGNINDGTHSYVVTFVIGGDGGAETIASPKSNVVTNVALTDGKNTVTIPVGPYGTTSRKLYRTVAGDTGSHLLVTTIADNTTTTYLDNTADAGLGAAAPTTANRMGTFKSTGETLGVVEQGIVNPLAPKTVSTDGQFDGPTSKALFPDLFDEGRVDNTVTGNTDKNTISSIDPNQGSGRPINSTPALSAARAVGASSAISGTQEFVSETVTLTTVGRRLPSSEEDAGVVISREIASRDSISPDGTKVVAGGFLYQVNWGSSAVSNPKRVKANNRWRVSLHAEADLVAA